MSRGTFYPPKDRNRPTELEQLRQVVDIWDLPSEPPAALSGVFVWYLGGNRVNGVDTVNSEGISNYLQLACDPGLVHTLHGCTTYACPRPPIGSPSASSASSSRRSASSGWFLASSSTSALRIQKHRCTAARTHTHIHTQQEPVNHL